MEPLTASTSTSGGGPWAVFSRYNEHVSGQYLPGDYAVDWVGDLVAIALNPKRKTHVFGTITPDMWKFSSVGTVITAGSSLNPRRVYWWTHPFTRPARGARHSTLLPTGDRYLTSAPDGWVAIDASGTLYDVNAATHTTTTLAQPFPGHTVDGAVAGPHELVVWDEEQIVAISFKTHTVTPLDTSDITPPDSNGSSVPFCWSVSDRAAACGSAYYIGGRSNVFIDPLNGDAAYGETTVPDPDCNTEAAVTGMTAAIDPCADSGPIRLITPTTSVSTRIDDEFLTLRAGLDGFLVSTQAHNALLAIRSNGKHSTLLPPAHSPIEATSFALTGRTIAWSQDGRASTTALTVHRRTLRQSAGRLIGGRPRTFAGHSIGGAVAVSASATAWITAAHRPRAQSRWSETLRVVSGKRSRKLRATGIVPSFPLSLSGHRLLYHDGGAALYNLRSGKTTNLHAHHAALSGKRVVFARPSAGGSIHERNFATGRTITLATDVRAAQVFIHGRHVGWTSMDSSDGTGPSSFYRNKPRGRTVALPAKQVIWALTDAGVVVESQPHTHIAFGPLRHFPNNDDLQLVPTVKFLLRPYTASRARPLLTGHYLDAGPQVANKVVAWIDPRGRVRAKDIG